MQGGLVARTLDEERDLNSAQPLFEDVPHVAVDPQMVQLVVQLVARQAGKYAAADLEVEAIAERFGIDTGKQILVVPMTNQQTLTHSYGG